MTIGVLSDTHIPSAAQKLPDAIFKAFKNVDMILHAGDITDISVLDELNKLAKIEAVWGNMDAAETQKKLPAKRIFEIEGFKIGLIHGHGSPFRIINTVKNEFPEKMDVIVFGHSHAPVNEVRDGTLFFNPGSPTDRIFAKYNSYGILRLNKKVKGEIIRLR